MAISRHDREKIQPGNRDDYATSGAGLRTLSASVIHIDELVRVGEIPDNVKLADRFFLGCSAGSSR
jgi:hypothetical protein